MSGAVERIEAALGAMEAAAKAAEADHYAVEGGLRWGEVGYETTPDLTVDPGLLLALTNGLRKVVALHQPIQMLTGPVCTSCGDADEHAVAWPCATLASLAAAVDPGVGDGREVRGE